MTVSEYERKFFELKQYAGFGQDTALLVQHFIRGLNARIIGKVLLFEPKTLREAVVKAKLIEANIASSYDRQPGGSSGSGFRGNQSLGSKNFKKLSNFYKGNQKSG